MKRALDNDVPEIAENQPAPKGNATLQHFNVVESVAATEISDSFNPSTLNVLGSDESCSLDEEITGRDSENDESEELNLIVEDQDLLHYVESSSEEHDEEDPVVPETTIDDNVNPASRTFTQSATKSLSILPQTFVVHTSKEVKKSIIVHKPARRNLVGPENFNVHLKTRTETDCCIIQTLLRRKFTQKSWNDTDRIDILRNGPPQPSIERLGLGSSECKYLPWLAGCASENKVYCWYCLLYSSRGVWCISATNEPFIQIASKHSSSKAHVEAKMLLKQWVFKAGIHQDFDTECSGTLKVPFPEKKKLELQCTCTNDATVSEASKKPTCLIVQLLKNRFTYNDTWTEKEREEIIQRGRPTPKLKLVIPDSTKLKINNVYKKVPWLAGSEETGKLFCWPCLLFSNGTWSTVGYQYSNTMSLIIHRHDLSQNHLEACLRLKVWERQVKRTDVVQKVFQQQHNDAVRKNRQFMKYVIDVICCFKKKVANTNVSYRDLMKVLEKISLYDEKLKHYLQVRTFFEDEISDIIESVKDCLKSRIIKEANDANFVALMLNEVCNAPMLSVVLRYVKKNGEVMERFLQFIEYKYDSSINNVVQNVLEIVDFLNRETKLVGFTHDDSAIVATDLAYFNAKITEKHPTATFFHYSDHNLKTLVLHSLSQMHECRTFLHQIQGLVKFFERNSIVKTSLTIIDQEISDNEDNSGYIWDFSLGLIKTINDHYPAMVKLFERMILSAVAWDAETVVQSQSFAHFLKLFENRFLIATFSRIFDDINELTIVMETDFNVNKWKKIAEKTTEAVIKTRCEDFEEILQSALNMSQTDLEFSYDIAYAEKFDLIMQSVSIVIHNRTKDLDKWSYIELATQPSIYGPGKSSLFNKYVDGLHHDFPNYGFDKLSKQLSFFKSNVLINRKTVDELIKYIYDLKMIPTLSPLHAFTQLVLTTTLYPNSTTKTPTMKKIAAYVSNHENVTSTDTLMYVEKDLLTELQNEPDFYESVINHYVKNYSEEHLEFLNNTDAL